MKIINNKLIKYDMIIYLIFILFSTFICLQSPLSPISNQYPGTDSSVFLYIGKYMSKGMVPYLDLFDHKGPLIYFINYLGYLIFGEIKGVWYIEIIFMLINLILSYKISNIFVNKLCAFFSTLTIFMPLHTLFEGGNLVEEYALPFIFISLFLCTKYFFEDFKHSKIYSTILGICCGCVLMLRPNMICLWIAFSIFIFFYTIYNKQYKVLSCYVAYFIIGFVIINGIFLFYLVKNDALNDFIYSFWIFNFKYTTSSTIMSYISVIVLFIGKSEFFLSSLGILIFYIIYNYNDESKRNINLYMLFNLGFLIITFTLISISGRNYSHYIMILIPCFIAPVAILIKTLYDMLNIDNLKYKILICLIIFICIFSYSGYKFMSNIASQVQLNKELEKISNLIKENTNYDEYIIVYGNYCSLYLSSDRKASSKYFYQSIGNVDKSIEELYIKDIKENKPKLIILTDFYNKQMSDFMTILINQNYDNLYNREDFRIYKLR